MEAQDRLLRNEEDVTWDPLSRPDYVLLVVASLHQVLVVAAVVHLAWCRKWAPYIVKSVPLVCVTGIAGVLNLVGVVITFGFVKYDEPSLLSNCFFQGWVTWTGAGLFYCAAVVRVYRNYMVLIRHSVDMWRPITQILVLQAPIWMVCFSLLSPAVTEMDYDLNRCEGHARFVLLAAFDYGGFLLLGAVYLLWKMRNVRKQMNEYRVMILAISFLSMSVVLLNLSAGAVAASHTLARRVAVANNLTRSALLFWPVIFTPMIKYVAKDVKYADQFMAGLEPSMTPAMLRASFAEQLKVEGLWVQFRKIAEERVPLTTLDFYKAVMDRDKEEEHFERQAKTMDVIDTYVADTSLCRVDISNGCRERILASEVSRYSIFSEAATEVVKVLQETCEEAFQASQAYGMLLEKAEVDEAEMEALKKAKLVPKEKPEYGRSGSRGYRSERWTNSTATGRNNSPVGFWARLWLCCPLRKVAVAYMRRPQPSPQRQQQKQGLHKASTTLTGSYPAKGRSNRRNRASVASDPAQHRTLGNTSECASQYTVGANTPTNGVGWGPASPLQWLDEEVKDIEMGEVSSEEAGNTRTPSILSISKDSRLFSRTSSRTSSYATPKSPPSPISSRMSSPSPIATRAQPQAVPPQKRSPPAPWAPWRRPPDHSIVPSLTSPPDVARGVSYFGADEKEVSMEEGVMERPRRNASWESVESLVMMMPPSPATPPTPGSSATSNDAGVQEQKQPHLSPSQADGAFVLAAARQARGDISGLEQFSFSEQADVTPRWCGMGDSLGRGGRQLDVERGIARALGEDTFESCGQFVSATGYAPKRGFMPKLKFLEVALEIERKEKEAEARKTLGDVSTAAAPPTCASSAVMVARSAEPVVKGEAVEDARNESAPCVSSHYPLAERLNPHGEDGGRPGDEAFRSSAVAPATMTTTKPTPVVSSGTRHSPSDACAQPAASWSLALSPTPSPSVGPLRELTNGHRSSNVVSPPFSLSSVSAASSPSSPQSPFNPEQHTAPSPEGALPPLPGQAPAMKGSAVAVAAPRERQPEPSAPPRALPRCFGQHRESSKGNLDTKPPGPMETSVLPTTFSSERAAHTAVERPLAVARPVSPPPTPPPLVEVPRRASDAEKRIAGRPGSRDGERAPRNRAVTATAHTAWPLQPVPAAPPSKAAGPARAQPARALAWDEPANTSNLRSSTTEFPPALPIRVTGSPLSPPARTPPLPPALLHLSYAALGGPNYLMFTPPSPAGWSNSASPSSVRSSPVLVRPPLFPPAGFSGRDTGAAGTGYLLAWSWSDSTLSGSRSGGSEVVSPLVGMRFVGDDGGGGSGSGSSKDPGSRLSSGTSTVAPAAGGGTDVPLMGVRGSPPIRCAHGVPGAAVATAAAAAAASAVAAVAANPSLEGGVGGRQGKRPRRFFFP